MTHTQEFEYAQWPASDRRICEEDFTYSTCTNFL